MPLDCTNLSTSFDAWEAATRAAITGYQGSGSSATPTTQAQDDAMLTLENDMGDATACILNKINTLGASSTDIAALQLQILDKTTKLADADKDISVAKDRVAYIRHPEQNTSNYESWFPIDRPIHYTSLIIIIALSIFLGVFYILMMLSVFNLDLVLYIEPIYNISPFFMWLSQQLTLSFWVVLIVLISVVIYFVKR